MVVVVATLLFHWNANTTIVSSKVLWIATRQKDFGVDDHPIQLNLPILLRSWLCPCPRDHRLHHRRLHHLRLVMMNTDVVSKKEVEAVEVVAVEITMVDTSSWEVAIVRNQPLQLQQLPQLW
jgi:hypothetical protein